MRKQTGYIKFEQFKKKLLANKKVKRAYDELEPEYQIACQVIEARLKQEISQEELAKRADTDQAVISRLETMTIKPSLSFLERIARALNTRISVTVQ